MFNIDGLEGISTPQTLRLDPEVVNRRFLRRIGIAMRVHDAMTPAGWTMLDFCGSGNCAATEISNIYGKSIHKIKALLRDFGRLGVNEIRALEPLAVVRFPISFGY